MKDQFSEWLLTSLRNDAAPKLIQNKILEHLERYHHREILGIYLVLRRQVADLGVVDYLKIIEEIEERIYQLILSKRVPPTPTEAESMRQNLYIVQREYPEIHPSGDRDFELYLQARQREDRAGARTIYTRLLNKYPDVDTRANLLRFWRKGRGLFHILFLEARLSLGANLNKKIRAYISALVEAFAHTGNQTLALMGSIRRATQILPPNKEISLALLEKLLNYSNFLNWHPIEFQSIYNILRSFYEETLFQQRKISLVTESEQTRKKATVKQIDLQKVSFTKEDLQQILVSPKIQGTTNLTLAYCRKYWLMVGDPLFENKILLYSQKYRTWHHSIFQAIARGKMLRQDDEVILMNVYNVISRNLPYDYDIRREYIMQVIWRKIKPQAVIKKQQQTEVAALPQPTRRRQTKQRDLKPSAERNGKKLKKPSKKEHTPDADTQPASVPDVPQKQSKPAAPSQRPKTIKPEKAREAVPTITPKSILDRIAEIDFTEQKNLPIIFRRNLEPEIETYIRSIGYLQKVELKPYTVSLATISVKNFILENMANIEPNWKLSKERLEVKELGLDIDDIQPIIENCLKSLRELAHAP